jgi:hypothetical protein
MRLRNVLLGLLSGLLVESAWAGPKNFFEERRDAMAAGQLAANSPANIKVSNLISPKFNKLNGNPNEIYCPPGVKCIDETYEDIRLSPEGRKGSFNYYGSMSGFAAGMKSPFHVKKTLEDYLPGDLTLAYITMGLTEPAVAAGLSQAVSYIGTDVNNRLQGEQAFFSQLQYMPEIAQSVGQAHINCIAYHMSHGEKSDTGKTWMAAQAMCSSDTADLSKKDEFDDTNTFNPTAFVYDPNHELAGSRPNGSGGEYVIRLSDYLFRRDGRSSAAVNKLQIAFTEVVGDIEYTLDDPMGTGAKAAGTRSIAFRKIPPVKSGGTYSFERNLQDEMRSVHSTLLELFTEVCGFTPSTGFQADPFKNFAFLNGSTDLFGNKKILDWSEKISFGGFTFDSLFAEALYKLVPRSSKNTCPNFTGAYDFDNLLANPGKVSTEGREFLFTSKLVAMGRLYSIFLQAEQYIRKLNVGAFDNFARQAAFELLYESAGSTDIQAVFQDNLQALENYKTSLNVRTDGKDNANRRVPSDLKEGSTADTGLPSTSGAPATS